jgi:salicylate hydroxylase
VASPRTIIVAGAGIGGLTAALALARTGFRVALFEQAAELSATGAGIQLSPNAARLLIELGVGEHLRPAAVTPQYLSIHRAQSGTELTRMPLGRDMERRFGAPYWIVHRGDLQAALLAAVRAVPEITLTLGTALQGFTARQDGVTVRIKGDTPLEAQGAALIGADGLWSKTRHALGDTAAPRFSGRVAWRATVPTAAMPEAFRDPAVHLWLGRDAHLVHYPVTGGTVTNIVAIANASRPHEGWSAPATPADVLRRFDPAHWSEAARDILRRPQAWLAWALCERPPSRQWGRGAVTLLGDAAHPMLPFLAQGGGMAIEDALVLGDCLARSDDTPAALRAYESLRQPRTARIQEAARFTGGIYQMGGPLAFLRNAIMSGTGGERLRARYDWVYGWRR